MREETEMHNLRTVAVGVVAIVAAATFAVSAFGSASSGKVVKIGSSNLGRILVDSHGKTLYLWAHDKGRKSTCNGDCAAYWPPLTTHGTPKALAGANQRLLGT